VDQPVMALTFDDGPSPDTTPRILDALREAGARATFFILGKHATRHPEVVRRIVAEGHEVASHGWTHGLMVFRSPRAIRRELRETETLLTDCGAPRPRLFRAPHGFRGPLLARVAGRLGYRLVGWSKGVFDTALPGAEVIAERSREAIRPGAILLLHDADGWGDADRSQTAEALPQILQDIESRGLRTVTVSELAALQRRPRRSWRRIIVVLAALGAVIGALLLKTGVDPIRHSIEVFKGINPWLVCAAIFANLLSIALKATVWEASLSSLENRPRVHYRHIVAAIFVGFLMNSMLVARAGELGRAIVLRRRIYRDTGDRVPLSTIAGTVVSENLVLGVTLIALLLGMTFTVKGLPTGVVKGVAVLALLVLAVALIVVGLELFRRWRRHRRPLEPQHPPRHWRSYTLQLEKVLHEISEGHRIFLHPRQAALALSAGLVSWIANLVAIWLTILAFGIESHALAAAVVVFAVSNLVGIVQVTPGNVGVFQIAIALALTNAYGIAQSKAVSFGVGLQAIEVGLGVGLGLFFLSEEGLSLAEVRHEEEEAESQKKELAEVS
jgi:uncharacterized protein (TIRG00374 family)